ncbi:MAG: hypothetical protein GX786_01435, partial [Clostridiales bacterium]|nr:hypothetical protein [Clostridiales bacterium]
EKTIVRRRRMDVRREEFYRERTTKDQPQIRVEPIQNRKASLPRKIAWMAILSIGLIFSGILTSQYNFLVEKKAILTTLQGQVQRQEETNESLKENLAESYDEVKVRYQAVQQLGMVSPKGVQSIQIAAPQTRIPSANMEIPENVGLFASLFAFLN